MSFRFSERSKKNLAGVHPELIKVANYALKISVVDFGIPDDGGYRSACRQFELFHEGLSNCDGFEIRSPHQECHAFDYFAYSRGAASWEQEDMALVAAAILQAGSILGVPLKWGGLWLNFTDSCHIELATRL